VAVDPSISRAIVLEELGRVEAVARTFGWEITLDASGLLFMVALTAHTGDRFALEVECRNYREVPPLLEFLDPETGERGVPRAYPKSNDSLFHTSGPCICAPFNRKAYKSLFPTGPHSNWDVGNWTTSRANGFDWSNVSTLGDMLGLIQARLSRPELYRGRLG
jgi:hypothetical protein